MNTCSTCRHWGCVVSGVCERIPSKNWHDAEPQDMAYTESLEDSCFVTAPDFGCLLHEPSVEKLAEITRDAMIQAHPAPCGHVTYRWLSECRECGNNRREAIYANP